MVYGAGYGADKLEATAMKQLRGYTLVELLLSIVIFSVIFVSPQISSVTHNLYE